MFFLEDEFLYWEAVSFNFERLVVNVMAGET